MLGQYFDDVVGGFIQCHLPDLGKTPNSGSCPARCLKTTHANDARFVYVVKRQMRQNFFDYGLYVWRELNIHAFIL